MSDTNYKTVPNELRHRNVFCDAVLKVEDEEFPVHRVILCLSSDYFKAIFATGKRNVTVDGISPEMMSLALEWIYTESTDLNRKTVHELLLAANMLHLEDLAQCCFRFLEENMCPENCVGIWKVSDAVVSVRTRELAQLFILSRFEDVVLCDEFQQLTAQELIGFIEDDRLIVKNETTVYQAILHWTKHHLQQRRQFFSHLLTKVRFSLFSFEFLHNNVLNNPLVLGSLDRSGMAHSAILAMCDVNARSRNSLSHPRLPGGILLAIGGWNRGDPTNIIEAYDYKLDRWVNVTNHRERARAYHGSVFLNGSVYCVGGFDRIEYYNTMRRLDLGTHTWHEMPPMYYRRCYVSVTVLNSRIYALGGYNGRERLNSAEVYDPQTNQWSLIASMSVKRSDANCAALNGKLYICGGFNGSDCLQTAESYCPESDQWTLIAPMITRRSGVSVAAYANHIYAVGGFDGNVRLGSVEVYSPCTDSWRQVASMNIPRSNFSVAVLNERIFAVGGYNGYSTTDRMESYDPLLDVWSEAWHMDISRSALNCCTISGLPNMANYIISREDLQLLDIEPVEEST